MNDKELIERYIYQVVRRLPKGQRDEVSLELQELISDMAEEQGSIEATLVKLGDPAEFAKKYMDDSRHLIGPAYYDTYLMVLKIALLCAVIAIFVISLSEGIADRLDKIDVQDIGSLVYAISKGLAIAIGNAFSAAFGVFSIVTFVFATLEWQKVDLDSISEKKGSAHDPKDQSGGSKAGWSPKCLAPVPQKNAIIRRGESIGNVIALVFIAVLFIFAPHYIALYSIDAEVVIVPLFNLDKWSIILPFILVSLFVGLADEILRLVVGRYNLKVMFSNIFSGVIQIVISAIILKVLPLWNPNLHNELRNYFNAREWPFSFDIWQVSNIVLSLFIVATLIKISITIYKTLRYGLGNDSKIAT